MGGGRGTEQIRSRIESRDTISSQQHSLVSLLERPSLQSELSQVGSSLAAGEGQGQGEGGLGEGKGGWQGLGQSGNSHKSTLEDNTGESEVQQPLQKQGKFSLRRQPHQRQAKSELSYCLRYCDLVTPLRPLPAAALQ